MLLRALCDVLILLDCCYAGSAARTDISGTNEILAACGRESTTLGVGAGSFTAKILRKIRSFKGKPFTVEQLYQRLLNDRKRMDITPQYAPLSGRRGLSIVLARMESKLTVDDLQVHSSAEPGSNESDPMTSASTSLVPSSETDTSGLSSPSEGPRVLIALSLEAEANVPDLEAWKTWLSTNAPEEIRSLEVTVETAFLSHSTLVLVSLPISVWNHLPDTSAYRFVGFITSENLLAPKAKQSGERKEISTLKEKAMTKNSSSLFSRGSSTVVSDETSSTVVSDEGHPFVISDPGTLSKPGRLSSTLHSQSVFRPAPTSNVSNESDAPLATFLGDHDPFMQMLLSKEANINTEGGGNNNALQVASFRGHDHAVQTLLEKGADVNARGGDYGNALQAASLGGHEKVVQMLLNKGADVNAQGGYYGNALQAASSKGHEKTMQMLLDKGADFNAQGGYYGNALQAASLGGHEKVVQMLLNKRADVNAQGGYYGNALQAASSKGHEKVVQMLLDNGADVNAQGGDNGNALQAALSQGHDQVVQMLLDHGADVRVQGGKYGNALQAASSGGHEKVVQTLLDKGADVNAKGGLYGNALQAASSHGHEKVVQMLLNKGADVNAQGGHWGNALQAASYYGHEKVAQMLLNKGADVNAQGGHWGNALQAASSRGHKKVVQLLSNHGAVVNRKNL